MSPARVAGSRHGEGENAGLHRFALFTACSTAFLIFIGGLVTSTQSGLSVPDWPTTWGENMFLFPPSKWIGGIFYEHTHRLVASSVGLLTVILTVWIWLRDTRAAVKWLSVAALAAVIGQGILGGLTVRYLLPTSISMTHACLAQAFFCLTIALALFTSPAWKAGLPTTQDRQGRLRLPILCAATTGAIYLQLMLGALMRHTESGLAIPDFPLAFGKVIPEFSSSKVVVHFAHRIGALLVTVMIVWTYARIRRYYSEYRMLLRPARVMLALVGVQLLLGAFTIWSVKGVFITTAHVANGAIVLGTSVVLLLRALAMVRAPEPALAHPIRETAWQ